MPALTPGAVRAGGPLVELLRHRRPDARPPFWYMRQAGRYLPEYREVRREAGDFLKLCYDPELAAEVTLQPMRRFDLDAAIVFADILLLADALGQEVRYVEGEGPRLSPPVRSAADVGRLRRDGAVARLQPVFETLARVRGQLAPDKAVIGFAGAPWTVAAYMVEGGSSSGFLAPRRWCAARPKAFAALIDLLVAATVDYLDAQIAAGADTVQLFDSWSGLLPPPAFRRWCVEPVAAIVRALKERRPEVPVIAFPRGAGTMLAGYAEATGVDAVSLDPTVVPGWAIAHVGGSAALQGNLDPALLVAGGEALAAEAGRILNAFAGAPHVFNLGHGIVPETPPDHVARLSDLVRAWRRA